MRKLLFGAIQLSPVYYPGCAITIPDPACSDCPTKENGRVRHLALKKVSYTFVDITNPVEWQTALTARNVYIFAYTKGTYSMTPNESPSFGNVENQLDSYSNVLELMEPNFAINRNFWNSIKGALNFVPIWGSASKIYEGTVPATIIPSFKIEDDVKSIINWNLKIEWTEANLPTIYDAPTGTFDRCIEP